MEITILIFPIYFLVIVKLVMRINTCTLLVVYVLTMSVMAC